MAETPSPGIRLATTPFLPPAEGGKAITGRTRAFFARPVEPVRDRAFEWNQCEIIVMGDQYAIHKLNGEVVNMATDLSVGEGIIGLQSETAEIFYRNMEIKEFEKPVPLDTFIATPPADQKGLRQ